MRISDTLAELAIKRTLRWEGGYVNDPDDAGGETNFGITIPTLKDAVSKGILDRDQTIKKLTIEDAVDVYFWLFWVERLKLHQKWCYPATSVVLFDSAVNSGQTQAVKFLQRGLINLGKVVMVDKEIASKVVDDGVIGPNTKSACSCIQKDAIMQSESPLYNGKTFDGVVALASSAYRNAFYNEIAKKGNNSKFLNGWLNRSRDITKFALNISGDLKLND